MTRLRQILNVFGFDGSIRRSYDKRRRMNSCLYECEIMHLRLKPKKHKLIHKIFMFYLDLDEIDSLNQKTKFVSHNRFSIYSFRDSDHIELGGKTAKENLLLYLKSKGVTAPPAKIKLLTNLRTFGHIFNPVAFYFCFDEKDNPLYVVPEIGNTFGELKPYFIGPQDFAEGKFRSQQTKYYYISPFTDLDITLDFQMKIPADELDIRVDDIQHGAKFLYATMIGKRKELNTGNLLWYSLKFPFVTLKVIGLIHLHAGLLYLKRIPHHMKESHQELQKEVFRAWRRS